MLLLINLSTELLHETKLFFDDEIIAHVSMAYPTSSGLMNACEEAIKKENIEYQRGGTYVVMEGPQFSTLAESNLYRSWNADVIGMTNMPEAKLAREAEIRYASVSMVTDLTAGIQIMKMLTFSK